MIKLSVHNVVIAHEQDKVQQTGYYRFCALAPQKILKTIVAEGSIFDIYFADNTDLYLWGHGIGHIGKIL